MSTNINENNDLSINEGNIKKGNKSIYKKAWFWILIILLIIVAYTYPYGSKKNNTIQSTAQEDKIYSIGDTVSYKGFDITLNDVIIKNKGTYIDSYYYISDPEWIGVILTVKNTNEKTKTFSNSYVKIINSNGEIIDASMIVYNIWGVEKLGSPELISGGIKQGYIQFTNTNNNNQSLILQIGNDEELLKKELKIKFNIGK